MPLKELVVPRFKTEQEEASWWDKNRRTVEANLRHSLREGKIRSLTDVLAQSKRKTSLQPVTLRLPDDDIATARQLAEDKGIGYQTYIKILLHDALRKEVARQSKGVSK